MSDNKPSKDVRAAGAPAAKPAQPLGYGHPSPSRLRRWARDTFTREQIASGLKQFAWVAPLTVLIWVYAEREQQVPGTVRFAVELRSNNPRTAVRLVEPVDEAISVDLRGPRNQLDNLKNELGSRSGTVSFEVPADLKAGQHQIPVTAITNRDIRFDGMTVTNSSPVRITVLVDPIEEELVTVQVREDDKAQFTAAVFNPTRVRVRMPRTARDAAREKSADKRLAVYADLAAVPDKTPGRKTDVSGIRVYVANADAADVQVEPSTVTASYEARERSKEYTIPELPLREMTYTEAREQSTVSFDRPNLFNIRVSGPPEAIDEIARTGGASVRALVSIDPDDRDRPARRKPVEFWTPDGVKVHPDDAKQTVEVTVRSKSQ